MRSCRRGRRRLRSRGDETRPPAEPVDSQLVVGHRGPADDPEVAARVRRSRERGPRSTRRPGAAAAVGDGLLAEQ